MKREEAIKILKHCGTENYCHHYIRTENCYGCNRREALDMAVEALSQPTYEKCTNLINKEDAIDELDEFIKPFVGLIGDMGAAINGAREVIKDIPSADRPTGEWIEVCDTSRICSITRLQCSKCGEEWLPEYTSRFNYCPNCGANMRDNKNENRD